MIYFKYIKMAIKGQLQYRMAFWWGALGQFLASSFWFIGVYLLFERFGNINGWSFGEVALCFGVTMCAFSTAECFARGFDLFSRMIIKGDFDRVMLRPRATVLQVMGGSFDIVRIGRFSQGLLVLLYAMSQIALNPVKCGLIFMMVLSGTVIFCGVFILGATVCFFTTEGLEVVNVFTDGGRELASYPLSIYAKGIAQFFTFVIPYGCFNYLPLLYIVGRVEGNPLPHVLSPLIGMLFLLPCLWVWNKGVGRYLSTGS